MTRYQEKVQRIQDGKKAKEASEERERQEDAKKKVDAAKKVEDARLARQGEVRKKRIREAEEKERVRLEKVAVEDEQLKTFQDFVERVCKKKLDHIQSTGEVEICEIKECGFFMLSFKPTEESEYTLDLHRGAVVWDTRPLLKKDKTIRVEQDPRIDYISIDVDNHGRYKAMQIYVQHGDPEEWQSDVPRESSNGHDGGYRSACEMGDIEYHQGSSSSDNDSGSVSGWCSDRRRGFNESVSNFFLDLGFFGGRQ